MKHFIQIVLSCMAFVSFNILYAEPTPQAKFDDRENAGYYTLILPIVEKSKSQGNWTVSAEGNIAGKFVGLLIKLDDATSKVHKDTREVTLTLPRGKDNNFLKLFASASNLTLPDKAPKETITLYAVVAEGEPMLTPGSSSKFELINISENPDYGEWYLTVDLKFNWVSFSEKNQQYREPLLDVFFD